MKLGRIGIVVAISTMSLAGWRSPAQAGGPTGEKPVVTLIVKFDKLTINRRNGTIDIIADAKASEGFAGTISGAITVSAPSNPSGVHLTTGSTGRSFPFTLRAGQKTSDTAPPQTATFRIRTAPDNHQSGILEYVVGVDPSASFAVPESSLSRTVEVRTVPY